MIIHDLMFDSNHQPAPAYALRHKIKVWLFLWAYGGMEW